MAVSRILKSGSLAALAAGLAVVALPMSAMADERGGYREGSGMGRGSEYRGSGEYRGGGGRAERSGNMWQGQRRTERSQEAAPARIGARQAPEASSDGARTRWNGERGNRGNWNQGSASPAPAPAPVVTDTGRRDMRGERQATDGWSGRNRSYADPGRNQSYRDNRRDDTLWRNDQRRDGDRWRNQDNGRRDNARRDNARRDGDWRDGNRVVWRGDARRWNRDWRRDSRYDWRGYRNAHRYHYRLDPYYAPYRGYSYRRVGTGFFLDSLFFGRNYWIADPWAYRLPDVDGPYRWVRYYDDVLLVDIYTGEVVDVIHDFFW